MGSDTLKLLTFKCLLPLSLVLQVTGLVLIIAGSVILARHHDYSDLIVQRFFTLPGFVVGTGVIVLLTSILGFYAAYSEHFYFILGVSISGLTCM